MGTFINLKKDQIDDGIIKSGTKLFDENGVNIGIAKRNLESWVIGTQNESYYGFVAGYTYKNNIKPHTIPELELEKILNSKDQLMFEDFQKFITEFQFKEGGLAVKDYEELKQFYILGTWMDDPSPIDRIRLMFLDNVLVSVIHERKLRVNNKNSIPLVRGLSILIFKDFQDKELHKFIENNKASYKGVD